MSKKRTNRTVWNSVEVFIFHHEILHDWTVWVDGHNVSLYKFHEVDLAIAFTIAIIRYCLCQCVWCEFEVCTFSRAVQIYEYTTLVLCIVTLRTSTACTNI